MTIWTIGFTQRSAQEFFETLRGAGIRRVIDVRLHNTGQLAGFSKRDDLAYFLRAILDADYVHEARLAPTEDLMDAYRGKKMAWPAFAAAIAALAAERGIESVLAPADFAEPTALLCSERSADRCHRSVLAEYLASRWQGATITHL